MADDDGPRGPSTKTRAEIMLQQLLERQLATSGRLERVDFKVAAKGPYSSIRGPGGVATIAEFREQQEDQSETTDNSRQKRRRYGADPSSVIYKQDETSTTDHEPDELDHDSIGRHEKELERSLVEGKNKLKSIAHLSIEATMRRKPLTDLSEVYKSTTPEERARQAAEQDGPRLPSEVFLAPAPRLLDMGSFLKSKASESDLEKQVQIPRETILANKLSLKALQEWCGGKFSDYTPGSSAETLYIKNLSSDVREADLASLFLRYQTAGKPVLFRLMQKGRMKGQAFISFQDKETAAEALDLVNGYILKGRPMVVSYARGPRAN